MGEEERNREALESVERPLLEEIHRRAQSEPERIAPSEVPLVYLSPADEVRRFPLLTPPRIRLIAAGAVLLVLLSAVVFLAWRKQQREALAVRAPEPASLSSSPTPTPDATPNPSPTEPDDAAILAAVQAAVANYNPTGYGKYTIEVRDRIVTIGGEAETQPEKDGVENVIRPLPGVKAIVNNLIVRLTPVMIPVRLNEAEAKRLDEAMRKQYESASRPAGESREGAEAKGSGEGNEKNEEAEREADRRRREAIAARIREEEERARRETEERLQREAAEYERKLEEQRRLDAERRARAEQARLEARVLRSGTIAWSGLVDGQVEVIIAGSSASVRNLSGEAPREVKSSFSAPVPRSPIAVKLISSSGRGAITIAQEPSAANGYTTIIRLDDSAKGGAQRYEFTLRWMAQ